MPRTISKCFAWVVPMAAALMLAGCTSKSADQALSEARSSLDRNDAKAATIVLKDLLQREPDLAAARLLLGRALLEAEDPAVALVELGKAADLKAPPDEVVPLLARAHLASRQMQRVMGLDQTHALTSPDAVADFKTTVSIAFAFEGRGEQSEEALDAALKARPDYGRALLQRAAKLAAQRDFEGALKVVDGVIARDKVDSDALLVKGEVLLASGNAAAAAEQYRAAIAVRQSNVGAHAALLERLLADREIDKAKAALTAMQSARPQHLLTKYYEGRLALLQGDLTAARQLAQVLLRNAPDFPKFLEFAGVVALQTGEAHGAETHFAKLVLQSPNTPHARLQLAAAQLRSGDAQKVLDTLAPLLAMKPPPPQALSLAGRAQLLRGNAKEAEQWLARAVVARPDDASSRTALALTRMRQGNDAGMTELSAVAAADESGTADLAFISSLVSRRDLTGALKAIESLDRKMPAKPLAPHLRGQVLAIKGDLAGARESFSAALAADTGYFAALAALVDLDRAAGKPELATKRLEEFIGTRPQHLPALLALARMRQEAGRIDDTRKLLTEAAEARPSDSRPRVALVRLHLAVGQTDAALAAAQAAIAASPDDPQALEALAQALSATQDHNQAINVYGKLAALTPRLPGPLLALAEAQLAGRAPDAALRSARKALLLAPDQPTVLQQVARIETSAGEYDSALAIARKVQTQQPKSALGHVIEGDVEAARKRWPAAAAAYKAALQREQVSGLAQRLHLALRGAGQRSQADAFAAEWRKSHPSEIAFAFHLATLALTDQQFSEAEGLLRQILAITPDQPATLNNLAWALLKQKKPGARQAAERAVDLAPNVANHLDTLATVLAEEGDLKRALEPQRKAVALAAGAHDMRLRLARLYVQLGDRDAARTELEILAKLGDGFAQQREVRELQARL